jgi:gamma-glutamyltranspeptidase/glutathione hydrolase
MLLQQLALLSGFDLAAIPPGSPELIHTDVECQARVRRPRGLLRRPAFTDVPIKELLSAEYTDERRALVGDTASGELRPGRIGRVTTPLPFFATRPPEHGGAYLPIPYIPPGAGRTNGDTVHLDFVDSAGNMASVTTSGGFLWGAPVVPGRGFSISVRGQIFGVKPGMPNSVAQGRRPRTTLWPTLVRKEGRGQVPLSGFAPVPPRSPWP